mgnify:CR=1 FL=1
MLFVIIWIIVLVISTYFFKKASGSLSVLKLNLNSISFYYSFLISSYIGSLLIVTGVDNFYMINRLVHEKTKIIGFFVICFVMLFYPLVMFLISKMLGFDSKHEFENYIKKDIELPFKQKNEFYIIFFGLSVISLLAILYTFWKTSYIPIIELLKGNEEFSPAELRILAQRNFEGNVLIRNIFAIALTPLLSLIAYVYSVRTKLVKWKLLFLVLFAGSVMINIYDLAKAPIFFYLLMFVLLRLYIGESRFTLKKLTLWGIIGFVMLVAMYIVIQGASDIKTFLSFNSGPIGRLILAQISPTFLHLDLFGETLPYLKGRSMPSIFLNLFDLEQIRSARLIMTTVFPEKVEAGTAGVLNTLFIAEAYANFGYTGIVFATFYVAVLVQIVYIIFLRLPKNPIFLSLYIYFSINIPRTLVGGFSDFLFNPIWFLLTFLLVGILLFIRLRIDFTTYLTRKKYGTKT